MTSRSGRSAAGAVSFFVRSRKTRDYPGQFPGASSSLLGRQREEKKGKTSCALSPRARAQELCKLAEFLCSSRGKGGRPYHPHAPACPYRPILLPSGLLTRWITRCYGDLPTDTDNVGGEPSRAIETEKEGERGGGGRNCEAKTACKSNGIAAVFVASRSDLLR